MIVIQGTVPCCRVSQLHLLTTFRLHSVLIILTVCVCVCVMFRGSYQHWRLMIVLSGVCTTLQSGCFQVRCWIILTASCVRIDPFTVLRQLACCDYYTADSISASHRYLVTFLAALAFTYKHTRTHPHKRLCISCRVGCFLLFRSFKYCWTRSMCKWAIIL